MDYEQRLDWYRQGRFTAEDVTRATGLSERSQRELLKLGVIDAIPQAKTKQRVINAHMLKRAALVAPLNRAGLSLGVAGRIVYAAMMLEDLVFDLMDPWDIYYDCLTEYDHSTGRYQPRKEPHNRDSWFKPGSVPQKESVDFFLGVIDSRFVMLGTDAPENAYGELLDDLSEFIWWEQCIYDHLKTRIADGILHMSVQGMDDHSSPPFGRFEITENPKTLPFRVQAASDEVSQLADAAKENPVSVLSINASLALRIALRRLLFIDTPE